MAARRRRQRRQRSCRLQRRRRRQPPKAQHLQSPAAAELLLLGGLLRGLTRSCSPVWVHKCCAMPRRPLLPLATRCGTAPLRCCAYRVFCRQAPPLQGIRTPAGARPGAGTCASSAAACAPRPGGPSRAAAPGRGRGVPARPPPRGRGGAPAAARLRATTAPAAAASAAPAGEDSCRPSGCAGSQLVGELVIMMTCAVVLRLIRGGGKCYVSRHHALPLLPLLAPPRACHRAAPCLQRLLPDSHCRSCNTTPAQG